MARDEDDDFTLFLDEDAKDSDETPQEPPKKAAIVPDDPEALDPFDFLESNVGPDPKKLWKPWMSGVEFILGTPENLPEAIDACIASKRYAIDLETTGLDNRVKTVDGLTRTVDRISGVALSPDGVKGYYFPLYHVEEGDDGHPVSASYNIPISLFDREFMRLVQATDQGLTVAIYHNGKFDQEFLQFNETGHPWGEWDKSTSFEDTFILVYMRNTRARRKGLKPFAETPPDAPPESAVGGPGLGMPMIELHELWGHTHPQKHFRYDFSTRDVKGGPALWYVCSDVICTFRGFTVLAPSVLEPDTDNRSQSRIYQIEKVCVAATRWMERGRIHASMEKILELVALGQQEWFDSIMDVYAEAKKILGRDVMPEIYKELQKRFVANDPKNILRDQLNQADRLTRHAATLPPIPGPAGTSWPAVYDINSQQQLGTMFDEMRVPGIKKTDKSGQVKTSKDELERIIEEAGEKFPFMAKIRRFREVAKAMSTYLEPMLLASDPTDHYSMRINFNGHKVDTGRFSTPAKESVGDTNRTFMQGWPELNVHSTPSTADPKRPACMNRLRECFATRPSGRKKTLPDGQQVVIPRFMVAIDYAGVELRLATNLSGERKWLDEFFHCSSCDRTFDRKPRSSSTKTPSPPPARCPNCGSDKIGDLHTLTALAIFGQDAQSRPDWKALRGDAKATNFALSYGGGGSAVCRATGVDKNEGNRIKSQFDQTYFGLKNWWTSQHRYAKQYGYVRTAFNRKYPVPDIYSQDGGFRSKAERNAVNGPIQGSSADITKTAMALIYKECKKRGWLDMCQMVITMHDELVFEIDADILEEAIPVLVDLMVSNPYILAMNWQVPLTTDVEIGYDWTVQWDLNAMRYGEVRFIGNKKYKDKSKLPEGVRWEDLSSWPDDLRPWFKEAQGAAPATVVPTPTPVPTQPAPERVETRVETSTPSVTPTPAEVVSTPRVENRVAVGNIGDEWLFKLQAPMSLQTSGKLAALILKCLGKGTNKLRIISAQGQRIEGWEQILGREILVNKEQFEILARDQGL